MKIAICQYNIKWEDKEANKRTLSKSTDIFFHHKNHDCDLLIFSEMTLTGFTMNNKASELSPADNQFFINMAKQNNINILYCGVENGYNKAILLNKEGIRIDEYSKNHLFSFAGEDKFYKKGDKTVTMEINGINITPTICFDLRFADMFWNNAEKTDLFIVSAAWPKSRIEHWKTLLRARAIENQAYVAGVNRIGFENELEYSGDSVIYDPLGNAISEPSASKEFFTAEINKEKIKEVRSEFPFLKERHK